MNKSWVLGAALLMPLAGCSEEAAAPVDPAEIEQGGQASGDVEGGTINDAMIPLEALQSTSPTIRRQTTVTTSSDGEGGTQTTVETTTSVTSSSSNVSSEPPAPAPPEPPAPPRG